MPGVNGRGTLRQALSRRELGAAWLFVDRVREEVRAELVQAALFGSRARGDGRPESDIDILLVFRWLPPDREPQAGHAEAIAEEVARETGLPITVWSVSLADLEEGSRTPMLVDALEDALPIWWFAAPLPSVRFTPADALRCSRALLDRVAEGSAEFSEHLERGDWGAACRRSRDDVVRLCTASLLLLGITRPRRADAVRHLERVLGGPAILDPRTLAILEWTRNSFGPDGRDEERPVCRPPGGLRAVADAIDGLRESVARSAASLAGSARG